MPQKGFEAFETTLKKCVAAFREAEVPTLLGGSLAIWARGGPETRHDLDFMVKPEDAERALQTLVDAGLRPERPPEGWLLKAWDGDTLVDLIYEPRGGPIDDAWLERSEEMDVFAVTMRVASLEDVMVTKLLAINEQHFDFSSVLETARAVREQLDWDEIRERTESSAFARAFLFLLEELDVIERSTVAHL